MTKASRPAEKRVCLAKIATAHGVRGLVKLYIYADDPYLLEQCAPVYTSENGDNTLQVKIKNAMGKASLWLAAIDGVTDRDQAVLLRNTGLWVARDTLPDIEDDDHFYIEDLVGLPVHDENGTHIGIVHAVDNFGASDLVEIRRKSGDTFYLPFDRAHVPDITESGITVRIPEDL